MVDNPEATEASRETAKINSKIQKVVVSDTLTPDDTGVWRDTTRIVRRADAHAAITDLKAGPGRDIVVFGSGTMWNDLFAAGLVDELYVMVGPSIVPGGTPAFTQYRTREPAAGRDQDAGRLGQRPDPLRDRRRPERPARGSAGLALPASGAASRHGRNRGTNAFTQTRRWSELGKPPGRVGSKMPVSRKNGWSRVGQNTPDRRIGSPMLGST